jgi:hypothetical protein
MDYFPCHKYMGCHPKPIDGLHHFSRWLLHQQPGILGLESGGFLWISLVPWESLGCYVSYSELAPFLLGYPPLTRYNPMGRARRYLVQHHFFPHVFGLVMQQEPKLS